MTQPNAFVLTFRSKKDNAFSVMKADWGRVGGTKQRDSHHNTGTWVSDP